MPKIYITEYACTGWTAYKQIGYGHQMKDQVAPVIMSEIYDDLTYANHYHPPLDIMGLELHEVSTKDLPKNIHTIEFIKCGVLNGMSFECMENIVKTARQKRDELNEDIFIILKKQCRIHLHQVWEWQTDQRITSDAFNLTRRQLYDKFMEKSGQNFEMYLDATKFNIAVHIRRGDISDPELKQKQVMGIQKIDDPNKMHSALSIEWYRKVIDHIQINQADNIDDCVVHIFTELRHSEDVVEFANSLPNGVLHRDRSFGEDFINIIHCNAVVMSNSGMSTLAGYLSLDSVKYYHPNPHSPRTLPQDEWIPML
tara:strand:+ start:8312 stop:9247 length:936 start_codon:yes stop_codon:yes gene_type:complete